MPEYPTTKSYPKSVFVRGISLRFVTCIYCDMFVFLQPGTDKLQPHSGTNLLQKGSTTILIDAACEGGNRNYFHMFGTRTKDES